MLSLLSIPPIVAVFGKAGFLTGLVVLAHIFISVCLVFLVLLHSGKGGGLSDMLGGGVGQAASGSTVAERNLDRITIAFAIAWSFTTMILAIRLQ